ncbi:MAG TPA: bifunctional diaminohydroxyphosphoribosylaminopyrimidine deaminase/5-amino-6-(5-phosphoribosylamino)uracil reductase RibD [Gemmatimonadaceae bacterium]|nr:bifunctional diaminohydroxyphosphoribosylaminopyrimidine deaminase/5-amino-6-(5-phosphoribosylamino)uracil reductase RibD [Gemmatimonadaceae bacterium]
MVEPLASADREWMRRALVLAARGWGRTAPNPMVGAVVVADGRMVGEGWHRRYGAAHAEVEALAAAGARARGATLYVTLEPCNHQGKTPPCVDAILAAGIRRVVAATEDPHPVAAGGAARLRAAGVDVTVGVLARAARELDAPFFHAAAGAIRPWVTLKLAITLDGAIADADGRSAWITGEWARRRVHRLRANADAIAVGSGTALVDDPALTVRDARRPRVPPLRVVFDRRLRMPPTSRLARSARDVPVLVLAGPHPDAATAAPLLAAGVEVVPTADLHDALVQLRERGVRHLLAEGGAGLVGALLRNALVDRLIIFQSPRILGAGARNAFAEVSPVPVTDARPLRLIVRRALGDDLMSVYALEGR